MEVASPVGPAEAIGVRLRRLRLERGLSQRQLACPGVSAAYISRIEAGTRRPSVKALRLLAGRLGVSADGLETGSELSERESREMRLADAELSLRLGKDPGAAEEAFGRLLDEALSAADLESVARARVGLGAVAAHRGDHAEAVAELEGAISSGLLSPLTHPDTYATLARSHTALGMPARAVQLLERCRQEVRDRAPDDLVSEIRFATYLSYALSDLGELGRARMVVREALARAKPLADPYSRVRLYWSLARLSLMEGKAGAALRSIRQAIGLLEATEDSLQLARAHLSCAEIMIEDGQAEDAGPHLQLAEQLLGPGADVGDLAWLRSEQAKRAARLGHAEEAISRAHEALELLGDADSAQQARAHGALAEAFATQGDAEAAHKAYLRMVELLERERRWREAAKACRAWASTLREAGREREALDVLERAADFALHVGSAGSR